MDDQPLPSTRGTYNFNFDDFDENTNPFGSSGTKLASSPPRKTVLSEKPTVSDDERYTTPERDDNSCLSNRLSSDIIDDGNNTVEMLDVDINDNTPKKSPQSRIKKPSPKKTDPPKSKIVKPVIRKSPEKNNQDIENVAPSPRPAAAVSSDVCADRPYSPASGLKSSPNPSPIGERTDSNQAADSTNSALSNVCDAEDLSPISAAPPVNHVTHLQDEFDIPDDEFRPASEIFNNTASWDMLESFGQKGEPTNLARESLYVKFDPLTKNSASVSAASPVPLPESVSELPEKPRQNVNVMESDEDLLMMHTPPPVGSKVKQHPAQRVLQKSKQFQSSALAQTSQPQTPPCAVDRIFATDNQPSLPRDMSGPAASTRLSNAVAAPLPNDAFIIEVLKYSEADLSKVRMEHQARLMTKERDWDKREHELLAEIQSHKDNIDKMKQSNEDMQKIVSEYERTVSQVIVDKAKLTNTTEENLNDAIKERNQAIEQLRTMESAFSDLFGRYEKAKSALESLKTNEEELKKCITEYQNKIKKHEQRYQLLKQHAEEKLQSANEEIDKIHKTKNSEIARIQAALKRSELHVSSLENSLQQKIQENKELTSICDDLIKQVDTNG